MCINNETDEAVLQNIENLGYHTCGENWGLFSEHEHFRTEYECPHCGCTNVIGQCAAWPITEDECCECYETISCSLLESVTGCSLR